MSVADEFVKKASDNVKSLLYLKQQAKEKVCQNADGSYEFSLRLKNDQVEDRRFIKIEAVDVDKIAPNAAVLKKAFEMAVYSHLDGKDNSEKFSKYVNMPTEEKAAVEALAQRDVEKFEEQARVEILVDHAVAPAIVNNAVHSSFAQAKKMGVLNGDEKIASELDGGYCAKSLTATLYEMKSKYGGFGFLPDDAEVAAHPQTFVKHLQQCPDTQDKIKKTAEGQSLRDMFLKNDFRAGTMAFINQGDGHFHAMLYSGEIKNGNPVFISFNNDDAALELRNKVKGGYVFDLPAALDGQKFSEREKEETGDLKLGEYQKDVLIANGKHKIKMNVSRKIAEMRENLSGKNKQEPNSSASPEKTIKNVSAMDVALLKFEKCKTDGKC